MIWFRSINSIKMPPPKKKGNSMGRRRIRDGSIKRANILNSIKNHKTKNKNYPLPYPLVYARSAAGNPRFFLSGLCTHKTRTLCLSMGYLEYRSGQIEKPIDIEIVSFLTGKTVKSHTKLRFILTPRG